MMICSQVGEDFCNFAPEIFSTLSVGKNYNNKIHYKMKKLFAWEASATLLLLLLSLFMPQKGWAAYTYETVTYHFGTAVANNGTLTMSSTSYSGITPEGIYADKLVYTENDTEITEDISKLAFRSRVNATQGNRGWILAGTGLYCVGTSYNPELAICNLHSGDKVTITYTSDASTPIEYLSGAHGYQSLGVLSTITSGTEITISQNGDMIIQAKDAHTYIQTIEIKTLQTVATYSVTTTEDTNNNTRSTTFAFTGEGRMEDNMISVPFMDVQFGSNLNSPLVEPLWGNDILIANTPDWNGHWHVWFDNNLPYQGTFYKFMPTASGKLQMNGFLSNGTTEGSTSTIHLYEVDESTGTYTSKADFTTSTLGGQKIQLPNNDWVKLEKGKTYYVCDDPNSRSYNYFGLHDFTFTNEFYMNQSVVLANGATSGSVAVKGATRLDGHTIKGASSNIDTSNLSVSFSGNATSGSVDISGIAYNDNNADKGGVIIMDLELDAGNATLVVTIPYSAAKGHIWNFYDTSKSTNAGTGPLAIGKYSDTTSDLYKETEAGKWKYTHRVINSQGVGTHDPMYQSVELMDGNNAAYIWETEGLIFNTPTLKACLYNENDLNATAYTDRYVGILPGGSFTIPGLAAGDRVIIYMGSGDGSSSDVCFFNITGAQDAIGTNIDATKTYKAGGSIWNGDHDDYNLRGAYHFISTGGPMTFYMNGGSMTKIYSIEIYQGNHKFTVDAVRTTATYQNTAYNAYTYQFLNTYKDDANTTKNACYQLHYRGKGDVLKTPVVLYSSGTVSTDVSHLFYGTIVSANGNVNPYIFYKSTPGEIGMFRMRIETIEQGTEAYVADYGLQNVIVGYLEKKTYPYTWDFTDMLSYNESKIQTEITSSSAYTTNCGLTEFMNTGGYNAVEYWKQYSDTYGGYGIQIRNNDDVGSGELMNSWGSQLYAGGQFLTEASGLGITPRQNESKRNGRLRITNEGLHLYEQSGDYWRITIPEVPSTSAVYVRVKEISDRGTPSVTVGDASTALTYTKTLSGKEYVYAVKGTGADMVLYFRNAIVQKIAVSEDAKSVNALGYATESRAKEIDPELMGYMTGTGLKAYTVTSVNYGDEAGDIPTITLTAVSSDYLIGSATNYDHNAYIIYNTDAAVSGSKAVSAIDGGFHLFVPDMHDMSTEENGKTVLDVSETNGFKNHLRSWLPGSPTSDVLPQTYDVYTNYVLSSKGTNVYTGKTETGVERFRRVAANVVPGNNKAFLPLLTKKVKPSSNDAGAKSMFAIVFVDDEQGTETTSLKGVDSTVRTYNDDCYYTLSGMKVSQPQKGSIYVKNGKKIIIK